MIKASLIDVATSRLLESFMNSFGRLIGTTTYQKEEGLWQSVSWAGAVVETVLVAPEGGGSIEICDIVLASEKKAGGTIRLHFEDSVPNEKEIINVSIADGSATLASNFIGRVHGWRDASLRYTIVGAHTGTLLVSFIKHNRDYSRSYEEMALLCGW